MVASSMNFMVLFSVTGCLLAYRQQKSPTVTDRASILASRYASGRNDAYRLLVHWPFVAEFNPPVDFREQGMIAPHSDVHARVYLCAGRYEEAEAMAGHLIEVFPGSHHGYQLLANSLLSTERYDEAITLIEGSHGEVAEGSPWMAGGFAYALAKDGRVEEARRMLYELEDAGFDWFPELYWVLGEEEKAMAQIEAAFEVHRDVLLTIRCRTEFENFMENPRFREIIDAIGFPN
jgi:tetratricopeptide (TPR) repeat protein